MAVDRRRRSPSWAKTSVNEIASPWSPAVTNVRDLSCSAVVTAIHLAVGDDCTTQALTAPGTSPPRTTRRPGRTGSAPTISTRPVVVDWALTDGNRRVGHAAARPAPVSQRVADQGPHRLKCYVSTEEGR